MVGVARMSLPDATRSDRVYPLLQNLDLENLAFATVQGVGNTLNIEEMNEDELRRLVLVNLARLTVAGEWDGLLSAGGGGGIGMIFPPIGNAKATNLLHWGHKSGPYGTSAQTTQSFATDYPCWIPIIARRTATFTDIAIYVTGGTGTTSNVDLGIYSDNAGQPGTLLGQATVDVNTSGEKSATLAAEAGQSLASVAGTQYWLCMVRQSGVGTFTMQAGNKSDVGMWAWTSGLSTSYGIIVQSDSTNTLPATAAFTGGFAWNILAMAVDYE